MSLTYFVTGLVLREEMNNRQYLRGVTVNVMTLDISDGHKVKEVSCVQTEEPRVLLQQFLPRAEFSCSSCLTNPLSIQPEWYVPARLVLYRQP